jgi:hypothetical protein
MELAIGGSGTASLYHYARQGQVFISYAAGVTALPAYSATALGPILWNGNTQTPQMKAVLIGISIAVTTASAAAVAVGLVGGIGQTAAPTSTTAATSVACSLVNGAQPTCTFYKAGTVSNAGGFFLPIFTMDTAALTAQPMGDIYVPLDGTIVVPQGSYIALAASATATTSVLQVGFVWMEVPY